MCILYTQTVFNIQAFSSVHTSHIYDMHCWRETPVNPSIWPNTQAATRSRKLIRLPKYLERITRTYVVRLGKQATRVCHAAPRTRYYWQLGCDDCLNSMLCVWDAKAIVIGVLECCICLYGPDDDILPRREDNAANVVSELFSSGRRW